MPFLPPNQQHQSTGVRSIEHGREQAGVRPAAAAAASRRRRMPMRSRLGRQPCSTRRRHPHSAAPRAPDPTIHTPTATSATSYRHIHTHAHMHRHTGYLLERRTPADSLRFCCKWRTLEWYGSVQGFTSHSTQNWSFRRRSFQPMSWLGTEKTAQNPTKLTNNIKPK